MASQKENENLQKEEKSLIANIKRRGDDLKAVEKSIADREKFLVQVNSDVEDARNKYNAVQRETDSLVGEVKAKIIEAGRLSDQIKKSRQVYDNESANHRNTLKALEESVRVESEQLENAVSELEADVAILDRDILNKKEELLNLKKEVGENEKQIKSNEKALIQTESSLKSKKAELMDSGSKVKKSNKKVIENLKKNEELKLAATQLETEYDEEKDKLEQMTKKRITVGQQLQVLNQAKEEIKRAYELAGMKYPYGD